MRTHGSSIPRRAIQKGCLIWHRGTIDELNFSEAIEQIDSRTWRKKILAFRRKSGSYILRGDIGFSRNIAIKIYQLFTGRRSKKNRCFVETPRGYFIYLFSWVFALRRGIAVL